MFFIDDVSSAPDGKPPFAVGGVTNARLSGKQLEQQPSRNISLWWKQIDDEIPGSLKTQTAKKQSSVCLKRQFRLIVK
jgi:hypothetical protein